jgi:hypothetical protein
MKLRQETFCNEGVEVEVRTQKVLAIAGVVLLLLTAAGATCTSKIPEVVSQPTVNASFSPAPDPVVVAQLYVSPSGRPDNSGTIDSPIDLASALSGTRVRPGTLIWLRGGTYLGAFESYLRGNENSPIIVRQYAGERAIIDGSGARGKRENAVLAVFGEWTTYWGFEVTNTDPNRGYRTYAQNQPDRPQGVVVKAPHTKFINMLVHDTGNGFGFWREAVDSELYGNLIFNCGASDPNSEGRGHGHAVYTQNDTGTKVIEDNITFNQFGRGINAYPNPGSLRGFHIEGNISFNNGIWQGEDIRYPNILVGGYAPFKSERMVVINNYTYHSSSQVAKTVKFTGANLCLGCSDPLENEDIVVEGNYAVGGVPVVYIGKWEKVTLKGNTFYGNNGLIRINPLNSSVTRYYDWGGNNYFGNAYGNGLFMIEGTSLPSVNDWKRTSGVDQNSSYSPSQPSGLKIFIRRNRYERGRANIAVYNWNHESAVTVNLNDVLEVGKPFEVRNVQDYFGAPVVKGNFDGRPVRLAMTGLRVVGPIGMRGSTTPTGPEFNAFVVLSPSGSISQQTSSTSGGDDRSADTGSRGRRATPPSQSASILSEAELQKFVGLYGVRNSPSELLIQLENGQLKAVAKNQPSYMLIPISPTRFRIEGRPPEFYVEFEVRDGKVLSLSTGSSKGRIATIRKN